MKRLVLGAFALAVVAAASPAFGQQAASQPAAGQPADNTQILRDKLKADKKLLIAENMKLTDVEAKAFWPIYDGYQKEIEAINQRIAKNIKDYADAYNAGALSDDTATRLGNDVLATDQAQVDLNKTYFGKLKGVIPPAKAARYIQLERKIRAVINYDLAAGIPLVK